MLGALHLPLAGIAPELHDDLVDLGHSGGSHRMSLALETAARQGRCKIDGVDFDFIRWDVKSVIPKPIEPRSKRKALDDDTWRRLREACYDQSRELGLAFDITSQTGFRKLLKMRLMNRNILKSSLSPAPRVLSTEKNCLLSN